MIQDLNSNKFRTLTIDDEKVGEIMPGLNQDYESNELNYIYHSPFVYMRQYKYNNINMK